MAVSLLVVVLVEVIRVPTARMSDAGDIFGKAVEATIELGDAVREPDRRLPCQHRLVDLDMPAAGPGQRKNVFVDRRCELRAE